MRDIKKVDLKKKSIEELNKIETNLIKDLFNCRFNKMFSSSKDISIISKLKKMISRIKTLKTLKDN